MVVCTHAYPISRENMEEQLKTVAETFWPGDVLMTSHVILCSIIGLGARDLLDRSTTAKPPFETIWDYDAVGYHVREPLFQYPALNSSPVRCQNSRDEEA